MPGAYYQNNKTTCFLRVKYLTWRRAPCRVLRTHAVNDAQQRQTYINRTMPFKSFRENYASSLCSLHLQQYDLPINWYNLQS